jgi:hypothetical protein
MLAVQPKKCTHVAFFGLLASARLSFMLAVVVVFSGFPAGYRLSPWCRKMKNI